MQTSGTTRVFIGWPLLDFTSYDVCLEVPGQAAGIPK